MANIISEPIMRLYRYVAGKWAKSAEVNEEMDMFVDSHNNVVTDLNALKNQQDIDRSDLQNQITTNKNDSESRDANLQSQITTNKNDSEARDTNLQNQINSLSSTKADKAEIYTKAQLDNGQLNNLYYTKEDLIPWLRGGDTNIKEEVYIIVSSDNGNGTFTYKDAADNLYTQPLTPEGYQVFALQDGYYEPGNNRIEIIVGDTLRRSEKSGGLLSIDTTHVALTQPEGAGAEITIKYYERIGIMAEYNIKMGVTRPPLNNGRTMWIEIIG